VNAPAKFLFCFFGLCLVATGIVTWILNNEQPIPGDFEAGVMMGFALAMFAVATGQTAIDWIGEWLKMREMKGPK
jgi:hypothetical protein